MRAPLARSGDAELIDFEFVGVTSPGKRPWQVAEATGRLVAKARPRFDRLVVDTSGFVAGGVAAAVKQRKIAAVDPDVVVAIQAGDECEHIIRGLATRARPRALRLSAVRGAQPRSSAARRRHREVALARYFADARATTLEASRVTLRSASGALIALDTLVAGTLVALQDVDGATLALGVIDAAEAAHDTLTLRAPPTRVPVATVVVGETTLRSAPSQCFS